MPRGLKFALSSFLIGAMSLGLGWAGTVLTPVSSQNTGSSDQGNWLEEVSLEATGDEGDGTLDALGENQVYAGAFKVNIAPDPEKYSGTWEKNQARCETFTAPHQSEPGHLTDFRVRWHENTNCIYTGGFDLGPAHAVGAFDEEYGLWARATAISDGDDTVVLMMLDASYYFAKYANMCNTDPTHESDFDGDGPGANRYDQDCGFRDLQVSMAEKYGYTGPDGRGELGIEPASFFLASSHAHAAPDFIGAWGGVPRWYMQQVEDAIREAVYGAIDSMQPTYLEADEILYRGGNNSRRRHYHAAEESGVSWMRFVAETDADPVCTTSDGSSAMAAQAEPGEEGSGEKGKDKDKDKDKPKKKPTPSPSDSPDPEPTESPDPEPTESPDPEPSETPTPEPTCTQPPPNRNAVATIGTYSAHPVNSSNGVAYADLSGVFAKGAEERFGGTGLFFQTGFGNMTSNGSRVNLANTLVQLLPDLGEGPQITGNLDVRTLMRTFDQPVTNTVLAAGGASGVFDRPMEGRPSAVSIGKDSLTADTSRLPHKRCNSASPITVNSSVSVARIGPANGGLLITGGPGELFSNYTNTIKEKNLGGITFPLSLVNDGLGYIMQSVETDHGGRQGVGFVNGPLSEYEDAYSIDACFGDHALEHTLAGMKQI